MQSRNRIRCAQSCATDAREAVREFHATVAQPDMALVIFFCSSAYELAALADEMKRLFAGVQVVGCTTAGEIGPAGYRDHSLTGASFPAASFTAVSACIDHLQQFDMARGGAFAQALMQRLASHAPQATTDNSFGLLLIDGLSVREEPVIRTLQSALGRLPLVGGSAGDGVNFRQTAVYFDGSFRSDSSLLTLVSTGLPFKLFITQHFVATDERLVVTEADVALRIVKEINGRPAAQEYARLLGVAVEELDTPHFVASPVVVLINGTNYVRSIQKVNLDGSLTFFCAIENGLVLRLARGVDLLDNLAQTFARVRAETGPLQFVLGCDCLLRKLEMRQNQLEERVGALLQHNNAIGFSTYGEQFRGVHVNQTLVGIAIGVDATETDDV